MKRVLGAPRLRAAALILVMGAAVAACSSGDNTGSDTAALSEQEYLAAKSKSSAEFYRVEDPPEVEVVRFVDSDEIDLVIRECMTGEGFPAHADGSYDVPLEQHELFNLAMYTCDMRYPLPVEYAQAWGTEQKEIQYEWTTQYLIPCLEEEGQRISAPPSKSEFVDQWDANPFYPFNDVTISTGDFNEEMDRLNLKCMQIAPGSVLWGDFTIDEWVAQRNS